MHYVKREKQSKVLLSCRACEPKNSAARYSLGDVEALMSWVQSTIVSPDL